MADVSVLTRVAAKKSMGVLGDDLALNAEQVAGVRAERELPVVWAVAKGSLFNKTILVPIALVLSQSAPWLIVPLLVIGGLYLSFEGAEKVVHKLRPDGHDRDSGALLHAAMLDPKVDLVRLVRDKIKRAIRTDFVLSAEIIAISLGAVAGQPLTQQAVTLVIIAVLMTAFVYLLVAGIVRLDDRGIALLKSARPTVQALGRLLLSGAPHLIRLLVLVGTLAMFSVGGHLITHPIPVLGHELSVWSGWGSLGTMVVEALAGLMSGLLLVGGFKLLDPVWGRLFAARATA